MTGNTYNFILEFNKPMSAEQFHKFCDKYNIKSLDEYFNFIQNLDEVKKLKELLNCEVSSYINDKR